MAALLLQLAAGAWTAGRVAAQSTTDPAPAEAPAPVSPAPTAPELISAPLPTTGPSAPTPAVEPARFVAAPPVDALDPAAGAPSTSPIATPVPAPEKTKEAPSVLAAQGKGITVTSADGNFQATFRSRMQLRDSVQHDDAGTTNEANVKTLRFYAQGHALVPELKYLIQLAFGPGDFEKDNASPIFDAFIEYTKLRDFNVRVGQYFVPFDRARTIREFALQFVDRQSVVRELSLDRDIGIMLSSADVFGLGGRLAYNVFVGAGDGRNRIADTKNAYGPQKPGGLFVGRITLRPMGPFDDDQEGDLTRSEKPHLALGVAAGYNLSSDRAQSTYGSTFTTGTFNYAHAAADLVFKFRGFSLLTEGLFRDANKNKSTGVDAMKMPVTEYSRSGYGYLAQAGQMLTDKLELTARWEELFAAKGTDPELQKLVKTRGRQAGAGLNYYLNGHFLKLQTDYFAIWGPRTTDDIRHAVRFQIDASF